MILFKIELSVSLEDLRILLYPFGIYFPIFGIERGEKTVFFQTDGFHLNSVLINF